MEFKGTKGNWEAVEQSVKGTYDIFSIPKTNGNHKTWIASVMSFESSGSLPTEVQSLNNAKLIAASPEMLVALQRIYQIENGAFGLKGFDVKRLKEEIKTVLDKALNQ